MAACRATVRLCPRQVYERWEGEGSQPVDRRHVEADQRRRVFPEPGGGLIEIQVGRWGVDAGPHSARVTVDCKKVCTYSLWSEEKRNRYFL